MSAKASTSTADQPQVVPSIFQKEPEAWRQSTGEPPANCPTYISDPTETHRYSIIILHGRGDIGPSFGRGLIEDDPDEDASAPSLRRLLPGTRFIFPTAAPLQSARFRGWKLNQWFDFWSLFDVHERPELQNSGLRENAKVVEALIDQEVEAVGIENVIVGGISNGAAQAMITSLLMIPSGKLHREYKLGGLFNLCGWLPYAEDLEKQAVAKSTDNRALNGAQQDVIEVSEQISPVATGTRLSRALQWLSATILDGNRTHEGILDDHEARMQVSVFLGHGSEDNTVPVERFEDASHSLKSLGFDVQSRLYDDLEHWYSDDMIGDLAQWIKDRQNTTQSGLQT